MANNGQNLNIFRGRYGTVFAIGLSVALIGVLIAVAATWSPDSDNVDAVEPTSTVTPEPASMPDQERPTSGATKLFFAGTGLTAGSAAIDPNYGYAVLVEQALAQGGAIDQVSMPTRREPAGTPRNLFSYPVEAIPTDVNIGIVELVTYDVGKSDINEYSQRYPEFVQTFRERNPKATLICLGGWTPTSGPAAPYERVARTACDDSDGHYVRLNTLFNDPRNRGPKTNISTFQADDALPNNLGSMRIAEAVLLPLTGFVPGVTQ